MFIVLRGLFFYLIEPPGDQFYIIKLCNLDILECMQISFLLQICCQKDETYSAFYNDLKLLLKIDSRLFVSFIIYKKCCRCVNNSNLKGIVKNVILIFSNNDFERVKTMKYKETPNVQISYIQSENRI